MRPALTPKKRLNFSFNPRICKRCDNALATRAIMETVSIHASVKDATCQLAYIKAVGVVSIHASVKDATVVCAALTNKSCVSIHASVKDATLNPFAKSRDLEFQSTHL